MGTLLSITVWAPTREEALDASEAAVAALEGAEARLSTWRETSELSRLNRGPIGAPVEIGPVLAAELARVRSFVDATGGAFDPGIGVLVEAWGLREGGRDPRAEELAAALAAGGLASLELGETWALRRDAGLAIEEGAFGKGIALDEAVAALRARGVERAWLDLGGQVAVLGADAGDEPHDPFVIGVADPRERDRIVLELAVGSGSVATSGNAERPIVVRGERRSHILDPRSGEPAPDFGSVTVWARDATTADCLSTALYVLGPEQGLAFAREREGVEALFLVRDGEGEGAGLRALATPGLAGRLEGPLQVRFGGAAAAPAGEERGQAGDDERLARLEADNAELSRRVDILSGELERLELGELFVPIGESMHGLGPAASKVYSVGEGLSIGGYGEGRYRSFKGSSSSDEIDLLRAVFYFGYKFSERWLFNSEIELEHASTGEEGSVSVEFAYLDFLAWAEASLRAGLVLVPMGFLNELHEPTTFLSVDRPETERRILPSTWRENGVGVFGDAGPVSYRAYVVNGFDATGFSAQGLRGGRQKGSEALAEDVALVARVDWTDTPGVLIGASVYHGDSGQDQAGLGDTGTLIYEAHAEVKARGFVARALHATAEVDDVAALNAAGGLTGAESVGESLEGCYLELGYDVLSAIAPESEMALLPFVRWETVDTQAEVPSGFVADPATSFDVVTFGIHFRPIDQVVFKVDYEDFHGGGDDRFQLAMGYAF